MDHSISEEGSKAVINLAGQLVSSDRDEFERVVSDVLQSGAENVDVHMSELTYMDSVGLGMLVGMRDEAEKHDVTVNLVEPQGNVKTLLDMARFDILFNIR